MSRNLQDVREHLAALQAMYEDLPEEEKRERERAYRNIQEASRTHARDNREPEGRPAVRKRRYGGQWRG